MSRGNLCTYFQPIITVPTIGNSCLAHVVAVEALLRERQIDGPPRFPFKYISSLLNRGGAEVLQRITRFVLFDACRASEALSQISDWPVSVAVNISPFQLEKGVFIVEDMLRILQASQVSPDTLILEITEEPCHISRDMVETVELLLRLGVRIAIDDLGAGSGNARPWKFPHSVLKLDRRLLQKQSLPALTSHLVLARQGRVDVVIEGVETARQMATARRFARDAGFRNILIQGFHDGYVPMPLETLLTFCKGKRLGVPTFENVA